MNSLSKVTLLVTLLTVPFAGFAMDFSDMPALEPDVVAEVAEQATEAAQNVAENTDWKDWAVNGVKALGSKASNYLPEMNQQTAGKTVGAVVLVGLATGVAKMVYDVARSPKTADSTDSKNEQVNPQDGKPAPQQPAQGQKPAANAPAAKTPAAKTPAATVEGQTPATQAPAKTPKLTGYAKVRAEAQAKKSQAK